MKRRYYIIEKPVRRYEGNVVVSEFVTVVSEEWIAKDLCDKYGFTYTESEVDDGISE